jgi:hypothetical protein
MWFLKLYACLAFWALCQWTLTGPVGTDITLAVLSVIGSDACGGREYLTSIGVGMHGR